MARILVVDDDPDILVTLAEVIATTLNGPDLQVDTAQDGEEARDRIARGDSYDMVITDERMPRLQGTELLAWVRQAAPRTKRVLMSAYSMEHMTGKERATADLLLQKPFSYAADVERIRAVLRGQTPGHYARGSPPAGT
jgi:DNA-binding response OmpR family regulator